MITEDFVSFETAKLLKENGFNSSVTSFYEEDGNPCVELYASKELDWNSKTEFYSRPTLQMAMKWLREKHNLHIGVLINYQYLPRKYEVHVMHIEKCEDIVVHPGTNFNTNEQALEAAINYCLENLI